MSEFPLADQFADGETVRAEEMAVSVPDRRSVRTVVNSTPIRSAAGTDSGTLSVAPEPSEVAALVERARSTFLSGGGRHAVLVDRRVGMPPVMAGRRRIVQVLNNLFSNAARHAPESTPIRVAVARDDARLAHGRLGVLRRWGQGALSVRASQNDAHVAVSVSDEGSGVAPERLPHLFSKHAGGGQGATAGHGLGLAICKGLVEAHGGRIRAESLGAGRGTTVTFTVPVAGEAAAAAVGRAAVAPAGPEPRRAAAHPGGRR